jgi:hypothetical protein
MLNPIANLQGRQVRGLGSVLQESLYTIFQLLLLLLLLLGIGGVAFSAISSDGWLLSPLKRAWHHDPVYAFLGTCAVVLGIGWTKKFFEQRLETVDYIGDILIYGWLVLGAYFGARLILTGSL